jgi:hypothetical protein
MVMGLSFVLVLLRSTWPSVHLRQYILVLMLVSGGVNFVRYGYTDLSLPDSGGYIFIVFTSLIFVVMTAVFFAK